MESIRTYTGQIDLCGSCGQPCYEGELYGDDLHWTHFREQWDGVGCQWFPLAGVPLGAKLDEDSIEAIREWYPDTYPSRGQ